jgi:hypothetical protein
MELTKRELKVLAEYYLDTVREIEYYSKWSGQTDSDEHRKLRSFANRRLEMIRDRLGDGDLDEVVGQVDKRWDGREELLTNCHSCGRMLPVEFFHGWGECIWCSGPPANHDGVDWYESRAAARIMADLHENTTAEEEEEGSDGG